MIRAAAQWDRGASGPCPHAKAVPNAESAPNSLLWITRQLAAAEAVAVEDEGVELDVEDELLAEEPDDSEVEDLDSVLAPESLLAAASTLPERLSVR